MVSSSATPTMQLVPYKFQGKTKRSRFINGYSKIRDTDLGHIDWNAFLTTCNNPHDQPNLITKMIQSGSVSVIAHPILVKSSKLIMAIAQHCVPDERILKAVIIEMVLDI